MSEQVEVIEGDHSCFKIFGVAGTGDFVDWSTTLVEWLDHTPSVPADLIVKTGAQFGPYAVTLRTSDERPPPDSTWEDVAELSIECGPEIGMGELVDGPEDMIEVAAGTYRARISARGRTESATRERTFPDDDVDLEDEEALEHYLLELWPTPAAAPALIRETSQFARDALAPPEPQWPDERDPGLAAARLVAADLSATPGSRTFSGVLCDIRVTMEAPGTTTQMFNRVKNTNGWPPSNGGSLSLNTAVGDRASHYGDPPDSDGLAPLLGTIDTEVVEYDKPRRFVMTWNWRVAGSDGTPYPHNPRLLDSDSIVAMTFVEINGNGTDPRCLITIKHNGVPIEWRDDLPSLWLWDLAVFAKR